MSDWRRYLICMGLGWLSGALYLGFMFASGLSEAAWGSPVGFGLTFGVTVLALWAYP